RSAAELGGGERDRARGAVGHPADPRRRVPPAHRGARMTIPSRSDIALLGRWLRARVKIQLRTGRAVVFTFAFPLVLIVLFNGLNGNAAVDAVGAAGQVKFAQFYTPAIGIFSLTTACYASVILGIATARDSGLLKRVRGTPLPMSIYLGAWLTGAALTGILAVVLLFVVAVP